MSSRRAAVDARRFDEELEAAIHGCGAAAGELAAARFLALGLAPLTEVPASVRERAWQKVQARMAAQAPRRLAWPLLHRQRWALGALGLLLALSIAVAAIGPAQVWAQVQRLLGYVPGIGFVDLADSRVLAEPVAVTRDGVTVCVDQTAARRDGTTVVFHSEGLPPEGAAPAGYGAADDPFPRLRLPDGETLAQRGGRLVYGAGTVTFPPLPAGVLEVTLELARLPLVPPGAAPEGWAVPLTLRPAMEQSVSGRLPTAYAPETAALSGGEVSLRVLDVAHGAGQTALRPRVEWQDPAWRLLEIGYAQRPELRDEGGRVYPTTFDSAEIAPITNAPGGRRFSLPVLLEPQAAPADEETLTFTPVPAGVRQLSLTFDRLSFCVPAEGSLALDLGSDPQVGDSWPLDADLQVAGFPVHVERAVLVVEPRLVDGRLERRRTLRFEITPMPEAGGSVIWAVELDGGPRFLAEGTAGYIRHRGVNTMWSGLVVPEGEVIPRGVVQVQVKGIYVALGGPWEVTWDVAGR